MNREKQIDKMAFIIQENSPLSKMSSDDLAESLYNADYRKASEIARNIFEELEASFGILAYPVVTAVGTIVTERADGLHISTQDYEVIKKKYLGGAEQ